MCDGNADCQNGSDEAYIMCERVQCEFKCLNNQCTLDKYKCDGVNQCIDVSDEINCVVSNITENCNEDQFECISVINEYEKYCINKSKICDSVRDCHDGSDEWPLICLSNDCSHIDGEYFKCEWNGACISKEQVCDQIVDCADSSDEKSCLLTASSDNYNFYCKFQCQNGTCLHEQQLCDRIYDCEFGEDETICNHTLCANSLQPCGKDINAFCKILPYNNYTCECKTGFFYDTQLEICRGKIYYLKFF